LSLLRESLRSLPRRSSPRLLEGDLSFRFKRSRSASLSASLFLSLSLSRSS
jgi:hypothetical protein